MLNESPENSAKSLTEEEKRALLKKLNHRKEAVRFDTLREVKSSSEALPRLLELYEMARRYNKRLFRWGLLAFLAWCGVSIWLMHNAPFLGSLLLPFFAPLFSLFSSQRSPALVELPKAISEFCDIRALPFLIDQYEKTGYWGSNEVLTVSLFRNLRTKDSSLLQESHRKILNDYLSKNSFYSVHLKVAIVKAYEQVGDEASLRTVYALLARNRNGTDWNAALVRQAAEECLPYLQQNLRQVTQIQALLRPSSSPEKQEELLRPARDVKEDEALLRASDSPK